MSLVSRVPTQAQLNNLLEYYQTSRFGNAEKLAISLTKEFPEHQLGWKVLGIVLKKTGRLSGSLVANQRSLQLDPQDAEAHNNLANTLKDLGRLDEAEASYKQAIVFKLDYAEAHNNLGAILIELGRLDEAKLRCSKAIALKPDFAEAHYNLGNTLQGLIRLDEAEVSYKRAIALSPDYSDAYNNLGVTLKKLGKPEEAEINYRQAITIKPDYAEAFSNLGNVLQELGRMEDSEVNCRKSIALNSNYAEAHNNLGNTLQELGRLEEAKASYLQATVLKPNYAEAHNNLGNTLQDLGRLGKAEESYLRATLFKPDYTEAHSNLLKCLYRMDKKSLFFDRLDSLINQDKVNAVIGSLTCRSLLKYGLEKPNLFCKEPLTYVLHNDLKKQYDFEKIFVKKIRSILKESKVSRRNQPLLVNGYQTSGNLFDIKNSFTDEIQKAIRLEIERYRINFKNSDEGLIKKWPTEYSLYGWLINMKSSGELKPHIHSQGWLSGSVYINVPPKSETNSGNLVVSLGEESDANNTRINVKKIINVITGSLVLFPGSLTHFTIPFEAEEDRIVLAFDVKQSD